MMVSVIILGVLVVVMSAFLAIALNRLDEVEQEATKWEREFDDAEARNEVLFANNQQLMFQANLAVESDELVQSLRERISSLIDERDALRAQVEMNDEAAEIENAIDYAAKHDMIGVGNVEGS